MDDTTRKLLGPDVLERVLNNLWPVDCQTCGRPLGSERPALHVADLVVVASASLHHRACQAPEWSRRPYVAGAGQVSWKTNTLMLFGVSSTGERDDRPLMLVNPHLEQVPLMATETGWEVATVPHFRRLGLRTPRHDFIVDAPIAGAQAHIHRAHVTVQLEGWPDAWTGTATQDVQDRIHELGGLIVGVTTAVNPDDLTRYEQLFSLIVSGELMFGWIPLAGTEDRQPLDTVMVPDSVTSYLLHWGERHASIAQVLAITDHALSESEVFDWATARLFSEARPQWPVDWRRVGEDPAAWYLLDPLAARFYFVRRHDDGWKLLKVLARISGDGFATEREAREWAEQAVHMRTDQRVFAWSPAAGTGLPGSTLRGTAG
ncbi:MAG: hypothetical protein ACRDT0_00815 [Pseudonocardiaceae bacterium]